MTNQMIEKITGNSPEAKSLNITQQNIEQLKQIFPDVFSENKIDFKSLKAVLGGEVDDSEERYNFTWNGKAKARQIAQIPSTGTLRPCKKESVNWDTTENLFIEGDNLEVLKLLQKSYHKKVKMIYIDPPYNTGKDFIYKDNFYDNIQNYLEQTGQVDSEGNKLSTNSDTSGRYHSNWLNMLYPRLKLARNLLKDDGMIFISIDDSEYSNLKQLCDEVFGEQNLIANTIRASNSMKNNSRYISVTHDYCLIYAKTLEQTQKGWKVKKRNVDDFIKVINRMEKKGLSVDEISSQLKELVKNPKYYDFDHYYYCDSNGVFRTDNSGGVDNGNMDSDIIHPITKKPCEKPKKGWRYKEETINKMILNDEFYFGKDEKTIPLPKRYLKDYLTTIPTSIGFFDTQIDSNFFKKNGILFDFPKPYLYLMHLLSMNTKKDDIILDFFAGSGTTAHAVMALNDQDGGNRRFINVQLPEKTQLKSNAYKSGFQTITEITKKRISCAINSINNNLYNGFKVFKLDETNIRPWDADFDNLEQVLQQATESIKSDRSNEDVLYEIFLKYGYDLTTPVDTETVNGKQVFVVGAGALIVCLDNEITGEVVEGIAKLKEELDPEITQVVFKDAGFADSNVKTNAIQILKQAGIDDVKSI
jgi:adenine-specific DNA-methyltransferase